MEQYDTDHRLSFTALPEKYLMKQWLQFQTTTQGPALQGAFAWQNMGNPTARSFYIKECLRVLKVLNDELADKQWLVGDKCSAADLSYVSFLYRMDFIMGADKPDMEKEFPNVDAWYKRMLERVTVRKVLEDQVNALKAINLPAGGKS